MGYRILHIDTEKTWRGGEQQVVSLIEKSSQSGHELHLAAPPNSAIAERIQPQWCKLVSTPLKNSIDIFSALQLARYCRANHIQLIHAHTSRAHSIGLIVKRFIGSSIKLVVSRRVQFPIRQGWFGRRKYRNVDCYLPISNAIADHLRESGIEEDKIRVVYSGIDTQRFQTPGRQKLIDEFHLEPDTFVVGNIAFCERRKRQKDIIDAIPLVLSQHNNVRFFIVGDGEERENLIAQAKKTGVYESIHFTGFRNGIENFYALFDVFVMVSEYEGLCNSLMEAQYFRVPVIATRVGGMPEIIQHEVNGLLIPPKQPDQIVEAILTMVRHPELCETLGATGHDIIMKQFTADAMVVGVENAYTSVIDGQVSNAQALQELVPMK